MQIFVKTVVSILIAINVLITHPATGEVNQQQEAVVQDQSQPVTSLLTQMGPRLEHEHASTLINDAAVREASAGLSRWLNHYGTASIDLHTNSAFSLRHSAIDLLFPLYEGRGQLLFTQFGLHDSDSETTRSLGIGQRWFLENWTLGYNAFYDAGWNSPHQRYGVGGEVWHDYVKFSANGYRAISGWRHSDQHRDYDARPADGWDLRAEGWLPFFPQLGTRLMYEHYYGEAVALTRFSDRHRNPVAMTAGLSYTPVPLINMGFDYKSGTNDIHDARFSLGVNWRLGESLSEQFDARRVDTRRQRNGSRLDLVSRNNAMVMNYKKRTLITLAFPAEIRAAALSEYTFVPQITSHHSVAHIALDDAALTTAGGKVIRASSSGITLLLPAATETPVRLSGTAIDSQGNRSGLAQTLIYAVPGAQRLIVAVDKTQATADGQDAMTFTATLTTEEETPLAGEPVSWQTDLGEITVHAAVTDAAGQVRASLTSQITGHAHVTALAGQQKSAAPGVNFIADPSRLITLTADKTSAPASGFSTDAVTLTARVTKKDGTPVANEPLRWATDVGTLAAPHAVTDENGIATLTLTSDTPGDAHVRVSTEHDQTARQTISFYEFLVLFLQARGCAIADGRDAVNLLVFVQNAAREPLMGEQVEWTTNHGQLSATTSTTDASGTSLITITSTEPGPARIFATVRGNTISHLLKFYKDEITSCD